MNDNDSDVRTGAQLLVEWNCVTREQKLERACIALTSTLNELHKAQLLQDLEDQQLFCSCADAYKMGREALLVDEQFCPGHTASDNDPKVCRHCGVHIDSLRP